MTDLHLLKRACSAYMKRIVDVPEVEQFPAMRTSKVMRCAGLSDEEATIHLRTLTNDFLAVYKWRGSSERLSYCPAQTDLEIEYEWSQQLPRG